VRALLHEVRSAQPPWQRSMLCMSREVGVDRAHAARIPIVAARSASRSAAPASGACGSGGRSVLRGLFRPLERAVSDIGAMELHSQSELRRSKTPVLLSGGARDRMGLFVLGARVIAGAHQSRSVCQTGVIIRLSMRHNLTFLAPEVRDVAAPGGPLRSDAQPRSGFQYWGICSSEPTAGASRSPQGRDPARAGEGFARKKSIC
jgi:hypothetical protein